MTPSIALPFKQMTTSEQVIFAKELITKLTTNPQFKSLRPSVNKLTIKLEEWQTAILNAKNGGKIKMIKKIEKGLTVRDNVFFLATQVEIMAEENQNDSLILAAGYDNKREISLSKNAFSTEQIEELLVALV